MNSVVTLLENFWRKPFDPNGSVFNWFMFLGLILVLLFLWHRIIEKIPNGV